jgi:hypothetical protein
VKVFWLGVSPEELGVIGQMFLTHFESLKEEKRQKFLKHTDILDITIDRPGLRRRVLDIAPRFEPWHLTRNWLDEFDSTQIGTFAVFNWKFG